MPYVAYPAPHPTRTLPRPTALRTLVAKRGNCVGVYLDPHTTGELAVGDRVGV